MQIEIPQYITVDKFHWDEDDEGREHWAVWFGTTPVFKMWVLPKWDTSDTRQEVMSEFGKMLALKIGD